MNKNEIEETKMFIVYLGLLHLHSLDICNVDGEITISNLKNDYPSFENIQNETTKIFEWLDKEK